MNHQLERSAVHAFGILAIAALLALATASTQAGSGSQGLSGGPAIDATVLAEAASTDTMIAEAEALVVDLYATQARAEQGLDPDPLQGAAAANYFTADIVDQLQAGEFGAHPLYGAQDFDGEIINIGRDSDQPMFRGMITVNVDFTNFGAPQRAVFLLRADTLQPDAPLRIFRVEHKGWLYP